MSVGLHTLLRVKGFRNAAILPPREQVDSDEDYYDIGLAIEEIVAPQY